jgi:hypothetical protein
VRRFDRHGRPLAARGLDIGEWARAAAVRMARHGHPLAALADYPLDRVVTLLHGVARAEARERIAFIADMGMVVGSLFGSGDDLKEHLDLLRTAAGEQL